MMEGKLYISDEDFFHYLSKIQGKFLVKFDVIESKDYLDHNIKNEEEEKKNKPAPN